MNKKRVLAIAGSPHRDGTTAAMLAYALDAAEKKGYQTQRIDLYEENISFCRGCRSCLKTGTCVQTDAMSELAKLVRQCDVLILASPVYFGTVSAAMKNFLDRLLGVVMDERFRARLRKDQRYILLTSCNAPWPISWIAGLSRGALGAMKQAFHYSGMKYRGSAVCAGAEKKQGLPPRVRRKIDRMIPA